MARLARFRAASWRRLLAAGNLLLRADKALCPLTWKKLFFDLVLLVIIFLLKIVQLVKYRGLVSSHSGMQGISCWLPQHTYLSLALCRVW